MDMVTTGESSHWCCVTDLGSVMLYDWPKKQQRRVPLQSDKVSYVQFNVNSCILATCYRTAELQWCLEVFNDVLSDSIRCVATLEFPSRILQLVLRKEYLCVVFEDSISVYSVPNLHLLRKQPTFGNSGDSCCAMSMDVPKLVLSCLGMQRGTIRIERFSSPPSSSVIAAHDTGIVSIGLSGNGLYVATSSERGSLIRIHSTFDDCALLYEVRRCLPILGPKTPQRDIRSVFMSPSGSFLASLTYDSRITVYRISTSSAPSPLTSEAKSISSLYNRYVAPLSSTSPWFTIRIPSVNKDIPSTVHAQFGSIPFTLVVQVDSNLFIYRFDGGEPNKVVLSRCDRIVPGDPSDESMTSDDTSLIQYTETESDHGSSSPPDWVVLNDTETFSPDFAQKFW